MYENYPIDNYIYLSERCRYLNAYYVTDLAITLSRPLRRLNLYQALTPRLEDFIKLK